MQNVKVQKEDYERYKIPFFPSAMLGTNKRRYISSELEKRHPCFSDEYCFDGVIKLNKKGLFFDVVVIKKIKLIEYKKRCGLVKGIVLEGCSGKRFYSKGKKQICAAVILVLFFIVFGFYINFNGKKIEVNNQISKGETEYETDETMISEKTTEITEILDNLFFQISENNGLIERITIRRQGEQWHFSALIKEMYPEAFLNMENENIRISAVKYSQNIPEFSIEKNWICKVKKSGNGSTDNYELHKSVRNVVFERNCEILEERWDPETVRIHAGENLNILKELDELFFLHGVAVIEFSLWWDSGYFLDISFGNSLDYTAGINLAHIHEYKRLFPMNRVLDKLPEIGKENNEHSELSVLKKLGEVTHKDGQRTIFFLNSEGRIIRKKGDEIYEN